MGDTEYLVSMPRYFPQEVLSIDTRMVGKLYPRDGRRQKSVVELLNWNQKIISKSFLNKISWCSYIMSYHIICKCQYFLEFIEKGKYEDKKWLKLVVAKKTNCKTIAANNQWVLTEMVPYIKMVL